MSNVAELLRTYPSHQPFLDGAGDLGKSTGTHPFVVGGYLRDLLMNRPTHDIDLMVAGDGIAFARAFAERLGVKRIVEYKKFGTAMIPLEEMQIEVATARTEQYDPGSRKPSVKYTSIQNDLARRDFTVNALAASVHPDHFGDLLDPFGGIQDMHKGILQTPLDPGLTFSDDPLRMLRAARFAAQLDFQVEPACLASILHEKDRISIVSWERITEELLKLLATDRPSVGFYLLREVQLLPYVFPELDVMSGIERRNGRAHKDVFIHTMQVVDNAAALSPKTRLRFAALVHDIAKPRTKRYDSQRGWTFYHHEEVGRQMLTGVALRMRLSNQLRDYLQKLTKLHLRPITLAQENITDSAVRRVMREAGEDIDDLMILCRADVTTKQEARKTKYMQNFERVESLMADVTMRDEMQAFQSPVRGDEIMAVCSITPGPRVGRIKSAIEDAILEGEIENTYDAAVEFLKRIKDEII